MQKYSATPKELMASIWRNRGLIKISVKREIQARYRGSVFGILWSVFNPAFMLAIYTFVFSVVFKARWGGGSDSKTEFALLLFAGLITFNLFGECVARAPTLIMSNTNYVKKVIFPLEILPIVTIGSALFHALISIIVWLFTYLLFYGFPQATSIFLPLVFIPLILYTMGATWCLTSLGVYLRDMSQFVGMLLTMLMFLSPVFYAAASLPIEYRKYLMLNPLSPIIEQAREVLYWGRAPDIMSLAASFIGGAIVAYLGFVCFQKTRKGFADVL